MYWKHTNESGVQPLKVNLIIYENDLLQVKSDIILKTLDHVTYFKVTGSSFYLWILECYPGMVKLVDFLMQEVRQMSLGGKF